MQNYSQPLEHGQEIRTAQANPAAGVGFTFTTSSQYVHQIIGLNFVYTADANAASRFIRLHLSEGANLKWIAIADAVVTANQVLVCTFAPNVGDDKYVNGVGFTASIPYPSQFKGTHSLVVTVTNIQVGDQISGISLYEHAWIP